MQPSERTPFLGPEHWRQTLAIVVPVLLALAGFFGMWWTDHAQLARNTEDIKIEQSARADYERRTETRHAETDKRLTRLEDKTDGMSSNELTLGTKLDVLGGSVNQLTLAVQKLTDLLPEPRTRR